MDGSLPIICTVGGCALTLVYFLYLYLLPKPYLGIPYNKEAVSSLFGDIAVAKRENPKNFPKWIADQAQRHDSAIVQLFLKPLGKPALLVCDYREAQDIMLRRKEFDRADGDIAIMSGVADHFHLALKTGAAWKAHRRLIQHLMSAEFLHEIAAPMIYESTMKLLELWEMKSTISAGQPFAADEDISHTALDAIYDFTFGDAFEGRLLLPQIQRLKELCSTRPPESAEISKDSDAFAFPQAPVDQRSNLLLHTVDLITTMARTGVPKLAWKFAILIPKTRREQRERTELIREQVLKGIQRLDEQSEKDGSDPVKCAVDHMLRQERDTAAKDGRPAEYWSPTMRDEILGFVIAGHDTTSTTLCWALKFLSDNQLAQTRLRKSLQLTHQSAINARCLPSYAEITSASIPYLDAFIEEVLRLAQTIGMQSRSASQDTTILGHHVPKDTQIFLGSRGTSFVTPPARIDESLRSETSQTALRQGRTRPYEEQMWYDTDMPGHVFEPARWLTTDPETSADPFDPLAWPSLPFGMGRRGCYGKKMAYIELRMIMTLLVWKFEFRVSRAVVWV